MGALLFHTSRWRHVNSLALAVPGLIDADFERVILRFCGPIKINKLIQNPVSRLLVRGQSRLADSLPPSTARIAGSLLDSRQHRMASRIFATNA
jgi:hypothetical protein